MCGKLWRFSQPEKKKTRLIAREERHTWSAHLFLSISVVGIRRDPSNEEKTKKNPKKIEKKKNRESGPESNSADQCFLSLDDFALVDSHSYTYSYSICVQGPLKFSEWAFTFTVRESKKTNISVISFRLNLSSDPKFLSYQFLTFASKSPAFSSLRWRERMQKKTFSGTWSNKSFQ